MNERTFMKLMELLPKAALSEFVGKATRLAAPRGLHQVAMRAFARKFDVALDEAEHGLEAYATFGDFFTRRLKPGLRPLAPGERVVISPVDGAVSQVGYALDGRCLQAKGISYTVAKLLGDEESARPFQGGAFATLYLSPRDYHRIHAPLAGRILGYRHIPGEFWPVNRASVHFKEALFCINERLVTLLETVAGQCAVVKVGATCVARIRASYDDVLTHVGGPGRLHRYPSPMPVGKGDELGVFEMGSTVILLFEKNRVRWESTLGPDSVVRMGQRLGDVL